MGFTTPCLIYKNTLELQDKLKILGYVEHPTMMNVDISSQFLICNRGFFAGFPIGYQEEIDNAIDCGTNENLFLAIAALRDDSNYMQWFITDSPLSVSYDDSIGNDHYFTEPKGSMFFWDENWNHATIISGSYHKATVEELINHFK